MSKSNIGSIDIYFKGDTEGVNKDTVGYTFIDKIQKEFMKKENEDLKDRLMLNMRDLTEIMEEIVDRLDLSEE